MSSDYTVRVHFIDGSERVVPAKDVRHVGKKGARSATTLLDGRAVPIHNRIEWGFEWYEQESKRGNRMADLSIERLQPCMYRVSTEREGITLGARDLCDLYNYARLNMRQLEQEAKAEAEQEQES